MTNCINCIYGQPAQVYDFTQDENIDIIYCNKTDDYIEMETATNEELGCDLYVEDLDVSTRKKS